MTIRDDLKSMGYRRYSNRYGELWAKPLAWQVITYRADAMEASMWFIGVDGSRNCWDSKLIDVEEDQFLGALKDVEAAFIESWRGNHTSTEFEFKGEE